MKFANRSEL